MSKAKIKQYANMVYSINKYLELYPGDPESLEVLRLIDEAGGLK